MTYLSKGHNQPLCKCECFIKIGRNNINVMAIINSINKKMFAEKKKVRRKISVGIFSDSLLLLICMTYLFNLKDQGYSDKGI